MPRLLAQEQDRSGTEPETGRGKQRGLPAGHAATGEDECGAHGDHAPAEQGVRVALASVGKAVAPAGVFLEDQAPSRRPARARHAQGQDLPRDQAPGVPVAAHGPHHHAHPPPHRLRRRRPRPARLSTPALDRGDPLRQRRAQQPPQPPRRSAGRLALPERPTHAAPRQFKGGPGRAHPAASPRSPCPSCRPSARPTTPATSTSPAPPQPTWPSSRNNWTPVTSRTSSAPACCDDLPTQGHTTVVGGCRKPPARRDPARWVWRHSGRWRTQSRGGGTASCTDRRFGHRTVRRHRPLGRRLPRPCLRRPTARRVTRAAALTGGSPLTEPEDAGRTTPVGVARRAQRKGAVQMLLRRCAHRGFPSVPERCTL